MDDQTRICNATAIVDFIMAVKLNCLELRRPMIPYDAPYDM